MDLAALVVSVIAAAIAGLGMVLTDRRSKEALRESRKAVTTALWSALLSAVQRLHGFDPTLEPVGDRLDNLRIASIELADEYADWPGLDTWLEAERVLGAALGRQVMEAAEPGDSVDRHLERLDPLISWTQALSNNLRLFRRDGYNKQALSRLQKNAECLSREVYERHGWDLPPASNPRLRTLD